MSHPLYQAPQEEELEESLEEKSKPKGIRIRIPLLAEKPWFTYALLVINIAIYAMKFINLDFYNESLLYPGFSYTQGIVEGREFYRLITAMFLHANEAHLFFNMLALYSIGVYLERYFGHLRFMLVYLLGGLLGGLAMLFVSEAGLGASGAIFAIFGAQIVFLYLHRDLFGEAGRAQMWSSIRVMALNFVIGILANVGTSLVGGNTMIGNAAHLGGAIGGALLSWFIAPRFQIQRTDYFGEGDLPITIVQSNPLSRQIIPLLVYMIGLVSILFLAVRLLA